MIDAKKIDSTCSKMEYDQSALHSAIWRIARGLRGSIDGWDFKQFFLGILFYRIISESLNFYVNRVKKVSGELNYNYAVLNDDEAESERDLVLKEKGFFIRPSELFGNVRKRTTDIIDLNETLEKVFRNIEDSAKNTKTNMKGLFEIFDLKSNKINATMTQRKEKLIKLLDAIGDLPIGNYDDNPIDLFDDINGLPIGSYDDISIDLFGDAYQCLMALYDTSAGKINGEFFTPSEVSELLTRITVVGKTEVNKVYDPTCGSGALLLKFAKVLGKKNIRGGYYGQEINITTYNLCRINMVLRGVDYNIAHGDTLTDPHHWEDEPFDAIVSNPPYSINWDGDSDPSLVNDRRFTPAGVLAPKSKADMAFVMHSLFWLAENGAAAIISSPGLMFRSGPEKKIRKYLVDNNYVDAVIQLPEDLFFSTITAPCILVLKRNKSDSKVLFIDASKEFVRVVIKIRRDAIKKKLNDDHIEKILNCYVNREDREYFSHLVESKEIERKNYDTSVHLYVAPKDTRKVVNITELNTHIKTIADRQNKLRTQKDAIVANLEGLAQ